MQVDPHGPLHGVRVLDASRVLAGPLCGQILGDLGAEVIKVERPGAGDDTRAWGPPFHESPNTERLSAYFLACNRNKSGLTLDLAKPEGSTIFRDLARRSDILLENFKSSSADKLGISPAHLHQVNPQLIVCSISGFGRTGPMSDVPGYDFAIQALSGLMSITGPVEGPPCKVGVAIADVVAGMNAAIAVLACLHARQQSGHGYAIDLSLLDGAVAAQVNLVQAFLTTGHAPPRQGNAHLQIVPYQAFATADDWLVLAVGNDEQWQRFCNAAGRPDLAADVRFLKNADRVKDRTLLIPQVEAVMKARTTAAWQQCLIEADVPHAPVWNYEQLFAHPQAAARNLRVSVRDSAGHEVQLAGLPYQISGATLPEPAMPPTLGQDTENVLGKLLALSPARLAELKARGII
jgi:crotonobetainyl-CoA:carnitine CoA-transferase CaiB-like acyl-CoA transferase